MRDCRKVHYPQTLKAGSAAMPAFPFPRGQLVRLSQITPKGIWPAKPGEFHRICRKLALVELQKENQDEVENSTLSAEDISAILGPRPFRRNDAVLEPRIGITTGLVWTETGGE